MYGSEKVKASVTTIRAINIGYYKCSGATIQSCAAEIKIIETPNPPPPPHV